MSIQIKRAFFAMACVVGGASPLMAQDSGGYYIKGFGGLSALQTDSFTLGGTASSLSFDNGVSLGGAFGYDYANSPYRAEVEFAYRSGDASDLPADIGTGGDFASTSLMLNGYYMFDTQSNWRPYAGLGVGYVTEIDFDVEAGDSSTEFSDRGLFAVQAMLGVEYPVSDRFSLYGEARYFTAGTADLSDSSGGILSADYDTFDLNIGAVLKF